MALTLAVYCAGSGELPTITFDLPRVIIGRGESCDLRLPDPTVSHHHASIRQRGSDYIIVDEGSTNGTFVGQVRLAPQAPRVIRNGDSIRVGRLWIDVRIGATATMTQSPLVTKDLALQLVAQSLKAQGEPAFPQLVVSEGKAEGTVLLLEEADHRYVLGRSATADLVIHDTNASRRHVEVWRRGASVFVRDLGSKNGTKLDVSYVLPDKPLEWRDGIVLGIGVERITLNDPTQQALEELGRAADAHLTDAEQNALLSEFQKNDPIKAPQPKSAQNCPEPPTPTARTLRRPLARADRVTRADLGVVFLALFVLAASLVGLLWMLSGK